MTVYIQIPVIMRCVIKGLQCIIKYYDKFCFLMGLAFCINNFPEEREKNDEADSDSIETLTKTIDGKLENRQ